jgi:hypothetical protein
VLFMCTCREKQKCGPTITHTVGDLDAQHKVDVFEYQYTWTIFIVCMSNSIVTHQHC